MSLTLKLNAIKLKKPHKNTANMSIYRWHRTMFLSFTCMFML